MTNARTVEARINERAVSRVLADHDRARAELLNRLEAWGDTRRWSLSAFHERLARPMRVIDLAVFIADHDDFHLARIDQIKRTASR